MNTFEEKAELFWQKYGYYPPGKDNPVGIGPADEAERWEQWIEFQADIEEDGDGL